MAHFVTFEQAKWIKEKGFDVPVFYCFDLLGNDKRLDEIWSQGCEGGMSLEDWLWDYNSPDFNLISKPEQHQVVEWFRVNHGIWVSVFNDDVNYFWMGIVLATKKRLKDGNAKEFDTPQEAYSAAFDYILNNLI
jgi:hypothetical protein